MSEYIIKAADWAIDYKGESLFKDCEEIVRCRDCQYYNLNTYSHFTCKLMQYYVEPGGFCAWGERRKRESTEVWNQWSANDVTCSEES